MWQIKPSRTWYLRRAAWISETFFSRVVECRKILPVPAGVRTHADPSAANARSETRSSGSQRREWNNRHRFSPGASRISPRCEPTHTAPSAPRTPTVHSA